MDGGFLKFDVDVGLFNQPPHEEPAMKKIFPLPRSLENNERGVPNFSYELAENFWRFPNEFATIRTRYRLKIVQVRN